MQDAAQKRSVQNAKELLLFAEPLAGAPAQWLPHQFLAPTTGGQMDISNVGVINCVCSFQAVSRRHIECSSQHLPPHRRRRYGPQEEAPPEFKEASSKEETSEYHARP